MTESYRLYRANQRRLSQALNEARPKLLFSYVFAGHAYPVLAHAPTPGDARAALKRTMGRLPNVVRKSRSPA